MTMPPSPPPPPPPPPPSPLPYQTPTGFPGGGPACPRCGGGPVAPVKFTWWGGVIGPKLLSHTRCGGCGYTFNAKTGRPNTTGIIIYTVVMLVIVAVVFLLIGQAGR